MKRGEPLHTATGMKNSRWVSGENSTYLLRFLVQSGN